MCNPSQRALRFCLSSGLWYNREVKKYGHIAMFSPLYENTFIGEETLRWLEIRESSLLIMSLPVRACYLLLLSYRLTL